MLSSLESRIHPSDLKLFLPRVGRPYLGDLGCRDSRNAAIILCLVEGDLSCRNNRNTAITLCLIEVSLSECTTYIGIEARMHWIGYYFLFDLYIDVLNALTWASNLQLFRHKVRAWVIMYARDSKVTKSYEVKVISYKYIVFSDVCYIFCASRIFK